MTCKNKIHKKILKKCFLCKKVLVFEAAGWLGPLTEGVCMFILGPFGFSQGSQLAVGVNVSTSHPVPVKSRLNVLSAVWICSETVTVKTAVTLILEFVLPVKINKVF